MGTAAYSISDLLNVMERLRDPQTGCPWDLQQDFRSIVPSTLEECYELAEAIEQGDYDHVAEELGDVLFQVIFYAQLGKEQSLFSFAEVVSTLVEKLIRRHPHVFAEGRTGGSRSIEEVKVSWESIKQQERQGRRQTGALADVPLALPALPRAQKVQKRAAQIEFDWTDTASVMRKLQEEFSELQEAMLSDDTLRVQEEMGDVFFTCVNLARHLGLDAETTLRHATAKFERRFQYMEVAASEQGADLTQMSASQRETLWEQAKASLGNK